MRNKIFKPSKRDRIEELQKLHDEASLALEELGMKYGKRGGEFWLQAEESSHHTDDYWQAMKLYRRMGMCIRMIYRIENGDNE